jgi:hypothetical protein
MDRVFDTVVDRTRTRLDVPRLRTLFGVGHRPHRSPGADLSPRQAVVIERPRWNLTLFKVHFGLFTLKGYTKGERVLRFEAIVHNTRALRTGRGLEKFPEIVTRLAGMVDRFTTMLDCVDVAFLPDGLLDELPRPCQIGAARIGGVDVNKTRIRATLAAVLALAVAPEGFTVAQLAGPQPAARIASLLAVEHPDCNVVTGLRECVTAGVLEPTDNGRYWFRHPLQSETLYAALLPEERSEWHRRFAALLQKSRSADPDSAAEDTAQLAEHWEGAGDLRLARQALPDRRRPRRGAEQSCPRASTARACPAATARQRPRQPGRRGPVAPGSAPQRVRPETIRRSCPLWRPCSPGPIPRRNRWSAPSC